MAQLKPRLVTTNSSSLAVTWGEDFDDFFDSLAGQLKSWLARGWIKAKELAAKMRDGAIAVIESIKQGTFIDLVKGMLKSNPGAVVAGAVAIVLIAGVVIGAVAAGIAAIAGFLGTIGLGGVAVGLACLPFALQLGQKFVNFDWQKTDGALLDELKAAYVNLAGKVGESLGRALAGLLIGRGKRVPLQINVKSTATLFLILEEQGKTDIQEEVLEALVGLAWAAMRYAGQIAFVAGYINFRKWARDNVRTGIPWMDNMIKDWGLQENRSWSIAKWVNEGVDEVQKADAALGNFLEEFLQGFGEGLSDFILMEYSR